MKKSLKIKLVSILFSIGCLVLAAACKSATPTLIWSGFSESGYAYLYEVYNCEIPVVSDKDGNVYEVKVEVYDENGNRVDSTGDFFVIRSASVYTVKYIVVRGGKKEIKESKIQGIEHVVYQLSEFPIYQVGTLVSLQEKLTTLSEDEISYKVKLGNQNIPLNEDDQFIASEKGLYEVVASVDRQDDFSFGVLVVEKGEYNAPNGLIADAEKTVANTKIVYKDTQEVNLPFLHTANATVSYDEEEKYDAKSDGSTKVEITYPEDSQSFYCDISVKPEFEYQYYSTLAKQGYERIAIRMKVTHTNLSIQNCSLGIFTQMNVSPFEVLDQDGTVLKKGSVDSSFWSNDIARINGKWMELLVPIDAFLALYADEMVLFRYGTGRVVSEEDSYVNDFGTLTLWIDNVYAVKPMESKAVDTVLACDLGSALNVYEALGYRKELDTDDLIATYSLYGREVDAKDGVLVLDESGVYSVNARLRNRYGVLRAKLYTNDLSPSLVYDRSNPFGIKTEMRYLATEGTETASYNVSHDETVKYNEQSNGSTLLTVVRPQGCKGVAIKLNFDYEFTETHYKALKELGYDYVSFRYYLADTTEDMVLYTLTEEAIAYQLVYRQYNTDLGRMETVTAYKNAAGEWSGDSTNGAWGLRKLGWCEIRIDVDTFLNYCSNGFSISLKSSGSKTDNYGEIKLYIDGIYFICTSTEKTDTIVPDKEWSDD